LGESPDRVWTVGAAGLDNIERLKLLDREELEDFLGIRLSVPSFLFTYHPPTLDTLDHGPRVNVYLKKLAETGGSIVITGVNADIGSTTIRESIKAFVAENPKRAVLIESMGSVRYLSAISHVDAVVGNSSSGLIEAPSLGVPTLDIGKRQLGRIRAPSVVNCEEDPLAFAKAITVVLSKSHRELSRQRQTPYGQPGAARKISDVIRSHSLEGLLIKKFYSVNIK